MNHKNADLGVLPPGKALSSLSNERGMQSTDNLIAWNQSLIHFAYTWEADGLYHCGKDRENNYVMRSESFANNCVVHCFCSMQ